MQFHQFNRAGALFIFNYIFTRFGHFSPAVSHSGATYREKTTNIAHERPISVFRLSQFESFIYCDNNLSDNNNNHFCGKAKSIRSRRRQNQLNGVNDAIFKCFLFRKWIRYAMLDKNETIKTANENEQKERKQRKIIVNELNRKLASHTERNHSLCYSS